jgi:ferrochelatase
VTVGVLAMAYGTPASPADVESYYTHIRRGRPADAASSWPTCSADTTRSAASRRCCGSPARSARACRTSLGDGFAVQLGQKHAAPFIEDGVEVLVESGVSAIVGLVLAPHYSAFSVGQYADRLAKAAAGTGCRHRPSTRGTRCRPT